jgi:hypothetical protein
MKVHELLDTPDKWTQGVYAKDSYGSEVDFNSEAAVCWCLQGAITHRYTSYRDEEGVFEDIQARLGVHLVDWNDKDGRTLDEIRALCLELDI